MFLHLGGSVRFSFHPPSFFLQLFINSVFVVLSLHILLSLAQFNFCSVKTFIMLAGSLADHWLQDNTNSFSLTDQVTHSFALTNFWANEMCLLKPVAVLGGIIHNSILWNVLTCFRTKSKMRWSITLSHLSIQCKATANKWLVPRITNTKTG